MSYKSYAQPGQYGTYHIDLPIKAEINEDLRAAGDFAKQMERSQNYREKWAGSYLSALNKKSGIERQNRDDNFEFLQNNFKRIYEGEQREFEGRLAELRREQHEAANAEPGFIEKLIPMLIELAPKALAVVGQMHTASLEADQALATELTRKVVDSGNSLITPGELNRFNNILSKPLPPGAPLDLYEQAIAARAKSMGLSTGEFQQMITLNGKGNYIMQRTLTAQLLPQVTATLEHSTTGNQIFCFSN